MVEVKLGPVSLLLHVYNHYTQQSTLALFIPCSGLPVVMKHGAFWGMEDEIIYFILFLLVIPCLYMPKCLHLPCENIRFKQFY